MPSLIEKEREVALRKLIFFYAFAILFDGIFRKWMLPSLSTPIMMVKEVLAIVICIVGIPFFPKMSNWEKVFVLLGTFVFITTLAFGHQNLLVAVYGCLSYWFGLPVCFIIGRVLRYKDLLLFCKLLVYSGIVNSVLLILQFCLPVTHFLNYQGGSIDVNIVGYSISSLEGGFRPSGIFVYNSQNALFQMLSLSAALFLIFMRSADRYRIVYCIALLLNIVSIPFTVSRTSVFYQVGVITFFSIFCLQRSQQKTLLKVIPLIVIAVIVSMSIPLVNTAIHTIVARFANASSSQFHGSSTMMGTLRDLWNRNIVYNIMAIVNPTTIDGDSVPFWGYGQGMSTQVGGRLLGITRNSGFALAEWDGLRIMCESGFILGWSIIYVRVAYAFRYLFELRRIKQRQKRLSLVLLPPFLVCFYLLNNWGNLFQANIAFLTGGLFLASLKYRILDSNPLKRASDHDH